MFKIKNGVLKKYIGNDKEIIIPEGVHKIGWLAFFTGPPAVSMTFPASLLKIDEIALNNCRYLNAIYVNEANKYFRSVDGVLFDKELKTLVYCPVAKKGDYVIPDGVQNIKGWAFNGCSLLTSVTIPDGVTSIGDFSFCFCSSLKSVTLPYNMEIIEYGAFGECTSLKTLNIVKGGKIITDTLEGELDNEYWQKIKKSLASSKVVSDEPKKNTTFAFDMTELLIAAEEELHKEKTISDEGTLSQEEFHKESTSYDAGLNEIIISQEKQISELITEVEGLKMQIGNLMFQNEELQRQNVELQEKVIYYKKKIPPKKINTFYPLSREELLEIAER